MILTNDDLELIDSAVVRCLPLLSEEERIDVLGRNPNDIELRFFLGSIDLEFFLRFYLHDMFPEPFSPLHQEALQNMQLFALQKGERRLAEVLPRGYGKSTMCAEGFPLWCICYTLRHHILIISNTRDQAKERLGNIKYQIENNERIEEDFGDLIGETWTTETIETVNMVKVACYGAGNKIRGRKYINWRPDLVVLDDIENDKNVVSKYQRKQLRRWFDQAVTRVGWKNIGILIVGNYIHHAGLLKSLAQTPSFKTQLGRALISWADNEELWEEWRRIRRDLSNEHRQDDATIFFEAHKEQMLAGSEVSWPEVYPYDRLMRIKMDDGDHTFYTELQNEPTDPESRFFQFGYYKQEVRRNSNGNPEIMLIPWDPEGGTGTEGAPTGDPAVPLNTCAIFGATDPSMGVGSKGDPYAIVVGARAPTGQCFLLEAEIDWREPTYIMQRQEYFMQKYHTREWAIESNQFQAYFAMLSRASSMEKGLYQTVKAITHTTDKNMRIMSLQPVLANRYLLAPLYGAQDWKTEAEEWTVDHTPAHVDGLDATEMLWTIMRAPTYNQSSPVVVGNKYQFGQEIKHIKLPREPESVRKEREAVHAAQERAKREGTPIRETVGELWYPRMRS